MTKTQAAPAANPAKVIIPRAILSYPKLFVPEAGPGGGDPNFGATFIPVNEDGSADTKTIDALKRAAAYVAKEKYGDKAVKMIKDGKLKFPVLKSTDEDAGHPEGGCYIRPRSKSKPMIVSRFADPKDPTKPAQITDPAEVYPGAICAASVVAFAYDFQGNKGISFALNGVQKIADGPRLAGAIPANEEFSPLEAAKDLADLEGAEAAEANEDESGGEDISDLVG